MNSILFFIDIFSIVYIMLRIDFIFSYWIFLWYLLYIFGIVKNYNPKFAILCGTIENIIIVLFMFYYKTKTILVFLFVIMFIILKLIPLFTLWKTKIHFKDVIATILLFIIYLILMTIFNKKSIFDFEKQTKNLILHNKNTLPGMMFLEKIKNNIYKF